MLDQDGFDNVVRRLYSKRVAIDSLVISVGADQYEHLFTDRGRQLHAVRSISKLVVSLCLGIAIDSGRFVVDNRLLDLDTPIWPTLRPKVKVTNASNACQLEKLTVRHLLTQTAGYLNDQLMFSSWLRNRDANSALDIILNEPIEVEPGTLFVYSNASAFILSAFFQELSGESVYEAAQRDLFTPLGISVHSWTCYGPYCAGATGLHLLIQDLHKLGRLILQGGTWQERQVVPSDFVNLMIKKHVDIGSGKWREHALSPTGYGLLVWISDKGYYLSGAMGQYLIVEPAKHTVISILASQEDSGPLLDCIRDAL